MENLNSSDMAVKAAQDRPMRKEIEAKLIILFPKSLYNTKVAPSETKSHASSEIFFWLKSMLKEYKNYVVKYFCPKLFRRLIIIKSPLVLILN